MSHSRFAQIRITAADTSGILSVLANQGYVIRNVECIDTLTLSFEVYEYDSSFVIKELTFRGVEAKLVGRNRVDDFLYILRSRAYIIIFFMVILGLTIWIPTRALFFEIAGCTHISEQTILEQLRMNGVKYGMKSKSIDSNSIKNAMMQENDQLSWVGITVQGCVVNIVIKESTVQHSPDEKESTLSHIVSKSDGIIASVTAENGTALCRPGQAVQTGQILISGYEDCGQHIKATSAKGSVEAFTYRNIYACCPTLAMSRTQILNKETQYSVILGKKQIKFYKDSGISPASCVKMYSREYITLPGGFQLPIALIKEECLYFNTESCYMQFDGGKWIESYLVDHTQSQMNSGRILEQHFTHKYMPSVYQVHAILSCIENIGVIRIEE